MTTELLYIPDLVSAAVDKVIAALPDLGVSYDWGNYFDIRRNLTEKDGNPTQPGKYPLVWLVTPITEYEVTGRGDLQTIADLRFIIANDTEPTYYMHERRDKVFLPILYPVLLELEKQMQKSQVFRYRDIPQKKDLQLARVDESGKHLLNDAADIIDVTFPRVQIKNKIC